MRIAKVVALVITILLIALSVYFYLSFVASQKRVEQVAARTKELVQAKTVMTAQSAVSAPSQASILIANDVPPESVPLTSIWRQLRQKADAGDAYSSCRLAMEIQRCALHERYEVPQKVRINEINEKAVNSPSASARDLKRLDGFEMRYATNAYVCSGFKNEEELSTDKYILRAALLGHERAKEFIATAPSLELLTGNGTMDSLVARRNYSSTFLHDLVQLGNERALSELAEQYAGRSWWNNILLPNEAKPSDVEAAVYAIAADIRLAQQRAINTSLQPFSYLSFLSLDKRLSDSELQQAREKAEQLTKGFPPLADDSKVSQRTLKENHPGIDLKVLMCRE